MPLPFLYPADGKIGRLLSSLENLILLVISLFAIYAWKRGKIPRSCTPMVICFSVVWCIHGLMAPDLGTAMRHKFFYLPLISPVLGIALATAANFARPSAKLKTDGSKAE